MEVWLQNWIFAHIWLGGDLDLWPCPNKSFSMDESCCLIDLSGVRPHNWIFDYIWSCGELDPWPNKPKLKQFHCHVIIHNTQVWDTYHNPCCHQISMKSLMHYGVILLTRFIWMDEWTDGRATWKHNALAPLSGQRHKNCIHQHIHVTNRKITFIVTAYSSQSPPVSLATHTGHKNFHVTVKPFEKYTSLRYILMSEITSLRYIQKSEIHTSIRKLLHWVEILTPRSYLSIFATYVTGMPGVIGAIDGTHVRVQRPSVNEQDYVNRKGFHSINVQVRLSCNSHIIVPQWHLHLTCQYMKLLLTLKISIPDCMHCKDIHNKSCR